MKKRKDFELGNINLTEFLDVNDFCYHNFIEYFSHKHRLNKTITIEERNALRIKTAIAWVKDCDDLRCGRYTRGTFK